MYYQEGVTLVKGLCLTTAERQVVAVLQTLVSPGQVSPVNVQVRPCEHLSVESMVLSLLVGRKSRVLLLFFLHACGLEISCIQVEVSSFMAVWFVAQLASALFRKWLLVVAVCSAFRLVSRLCHMLLVPVLRIL